MHSSAKADEDFVVEEFLARLEISELAPGTVRSYRRSLSMFVDYLDRRLGPGWVWRDVDHRIVAGYVKEERTRGTKPATIAARLSGIKGFCTDVLELNPYRMPRIQKSRRLPAFVPPDLMREVLELARLRVLTEGGWISSRNWALIEIAYSTGALTAELEALNRDDVTAIAGAGEFAAATAGYATLDVGGDRERVVPLGSHAVRALLTYLHARPRVVGSKTDQGALFISQQTGMRLMRRGIQRAVSMMLMPIVNEAGLGVKIIRTSCIVHLLDNAPNSLSSLIL